MIISEQVGKITGDQYDEYGFQFQVETYLFNEKSEAIKVTYCFPFNQKLPKEIALDKFKFKQVKITVEMEEE